MAAPTPYPLRYDDSNPPKILFPCDGLPTRAKGLTPEWIEKTKYVLQALDTDKSPVAYNPVKIGTTAIDTLTTYGHNKVISTIAEKLTKCDNFKNTFILKGKETTFSQQSHFGPMFKGMISDFKIDKLGTLKLIYETIVATIESYDWREEAIDKFCEDMGIDYAGELTKQSTVPGVKKYHCFLNIIGDAAVKKS